MTGRSAGRASTSPTVTSTSGRVPTSAPTCRSAPPLPPHPPFWAATGDPETSAELGRRGIVNALVLRGPEASKRAFDAYRAARREAGLPAPGTDRFAYAALCYVGDTDEEGVRVGSKNLWFLNTSLKQAPQMSKFLPGRMPPEIAAQNYRTVARPGNPG